MAEDRMLNDEILLGLIKANSGGGGGGTTNYNLLSNKPQINSVELSGNKSLSDLGIASASALANKVDKVEGKGLSTNDYDDTEKQKNADNATAITGIKNSTTINDFAGVETALDGVATALATKQNATDNSLDTTAKTIVGAINEHEGDISSLKSGLTNAENSIITPSCGYTKLGSGAVDGANPVVVSLGNNNIMDYDVLYVCVAYYESGIATYGSLMIPSLITIWLYGGDSGVVFFANNDAFNGIVSVSIVLSTGNNTITFSPSATPAGGYYNVFGVKWRTSN